MTTNSKWSRDLRGKSRYFRRDNEGLLYFAFRSSFYPVNLNTARCILSWLSVCNLLGIIILALTLALIFRSNYVPSIVFFVTSTILLDIVLRPWLLKQLSRNLTAVEDLPSSAWKQYWLAEILMIDGVTSGCIIIFLSIPIGFTIYDALNGDPLFGTLFAIFFIVTSLAVIYRLTRMISFKHGPQTKK